MPRIENDYLVLNDGSKLALEILESAAGFYIGTWQDGPYSRESELYFETYEEAFEALATGQWIPRL